MVRAMNESSWPSFWLAALMFLIFRARTRRDFGHGTLACGFVSGMWLVSAAGCKPAASAESAPAVEAHESWCPTGFEQGPSDTCFAIPEPLPKDAPVLVYLHGMY